MSGKLFLFVAAVLALAASPALARVEKITVHGASLEGNLEANSPDRTVLVILPPSYDRARARRFPVVYFLHGFTSTAEKTQEHAKVAEAVAGLGGANELIVVMPDSDTLHGGSMYSSSPTTGDFITFVARDLVTAIDARYRTIARRESRGLSGHSMGGYGTLRIGMRHPEVFSSLYAMSACCLIPRPAEAADPKFETMTVAQATAGDFMTRANFAVASAWSPNPKKPPFYADLGTKGGKPDMAVLARWWANSPQVLVAQHAPALKAMKAVAMDVGDDDFLFKENVAMHQTLEQFGITHSWTIYDGDHVNRVAERFRGHVLPFFAAHLVTGR